MADLALSVALEVGVVPGEPTLGRMTERHAALRLLDLLSPPVLSFGADLEPGVTVAERRGEQFADPVDGGLEGAWVVRRSRNTLGATNHQQVREATDERAEIRAGAVFPEILQRLPIHPANIDAPECSGDRVEAGRVHDHIQLVVTGDRLDARGRDALDRCVRRIAEVHVRPVVRLEVVRFQGNCCIPKP